MQQGELLGSERVEGSGLGRRKAGLWTTEAPQKRSGAKEHD